MRVRSTVLAGAVMLAVVGGALAGAAYVWLLPGLSVADQEPSPLEVKIATWLLNHSVPASAANASNPLGARPDPAEIRAGHDLFTKKCETCHAYDGGGKTEIGAGNFPRPPVLRPDRVCVDRGSMPYSAVTQPLPCPSRNDGTFSSTDAVQMTRVSPNAISTDPSAYRLKSGVMVTGRS